MCGVHQAAESVRTTITILNSVWVGTVIPPVASAGKLRNGHKLDGGNTHPFQSVQMRDYRIKGPLGRKCTDMQFVKNTFLEVRSHPASVAPAKFGEVHKL